MIRNWILFAILCTAALAPAAAKSAEVYVVGRVTMRAGPAREFPAVAMLPGGASVSVYGCIEDWTWCDVSWRGNRGWAYAGRLEYDYHGDRLVISEYGPALWLPIVTFDLSLYWDENYRDRPWFRDRDRWAQYRLPKARKVRRTPLPEHGQDAREESDRQVDHGPDE